MASLIVDNDWQKAGAGSPPPRSIQAARAAVARDPLDVVGLRTYGLALDRTGQHARAEAVLGFVLMRSWRDMPTLEWLIPRRIAQGDYVNALAQADALMRRDINNDLRERLITLMWAAASDDGARPALVARLNARPWWRANFLQRLTQTAPLDGVRAVLLAMTRGPAPPDPSEAAPYIQRLVDARRYSQALADWSALRGDAAARSSPLRDGDFNAPADPTAFGWRPAQGVGGESAVEPAPDGQPGGALRVDYDGFSNPTLPRQLLVLPPGRYRASWRERREPDEPRRLDWTVACADSGAVISSDMGVWGNGKWRIMTKAVVVPASGCAGQWLSLTASPAERRAPVTAWYAHMTLEPLG